MTNTVPPHSIEAEMATLGAIFVEPECFNEIGLIIKSPEMFFRESHQHIYRAMQTLGHEGREIDWVTVLEQVKSSGAMDVCGGQDALSSYLVDLSQAVPSAYGAENYAATVRDAWVKRKIIDLGGEMRDSATQPTETPIHLLGLARARIDDISDGCIVNEPISIEESVKEAADDARKGGATGETVGLKSLDAITNGFRPGQLIVIGGRPGQGKSALVTQIADYHQLHESNVFMASLEMSHREIAERLVSMRSGVDSMRYKRWQMTEDEKRRAAEAERSLVGHLWIDSEFTMSADDIAMKSRRLHNRHGLKLIIIDYIQLVRSDRGLERHLQIGESTRRFKALARELEIPVIVAAQLNRDSIKEKRPPTLADLRESGNIEQDADQVLLLHWPQDGDIGNVARVEVHVAKNRGGPCGTVELEFRKAQTRFREPGTPDFASIKP